MTLTTKAITCLTSLLIIANITAKASIIVPTDLNPGDSYRFIFVTDGTINATSNDVAVYNAFVTAQATAVTELDELATTWTAIVSTQSVDARDNTTTNPSLSTGVPIYLFDGTRIATNYTDLWDESIENPINLTQTTKTVTSTVWTGTGGDGAEFTYYDGPLGAATQAIAGRTNVTNTNWVRGPQENSSTSLPLYGISGILTVPVPEPTSLSLIGGLIALLSVAIRRR